MSLAITGKQFQTGPPKVAGEHFYRRNISTPTLLDEGGDVEAIDLTLEISDTTLPILATGNDIREVVRYLKNKSSGVTFIEAMNAEPRRIFDARKIAAYEFW